MSHPLKTGLAAAAAAALFCLPTTVVHAASSSLAGQSLTQTQIASDFLTQTINQSAATGAAVGASDDDLQVSVFVQSAPARRNPLSENLRGDSDLALWNLVASIRAQQAGNSFDLIDTGLTSLQVASAGGAVSPVPLPGAAWLFVMGVLGLTGTRLTGTTPTPSDEKKDKVRRSSMGSLGAAVPA